MKKKSQEEKMGARKLRSKAQLSRRDKRGTLRASKKEVVVKRIRKQTTPTTDLERKLEAAGMSMYELARRTGYSYQHVWNFCRGRTVGSPEFVEAAERSLAEFIAERKKR